MIPSVPDGRTIFIFLERIHADVQAGAFKDRLSRAGAGGPGLVAGTGDRGQVRAPQRAVPAALVVPGRSDHRQQPHGRAPRLGPDVSRPVSALPDDARIPPALPERVRLSGAG